MVDRVEVPDRILEILLKGTSATPSERYQTAQALRTDLEKVAAAMVPAEGNAVRPKRPVWIAVVIAAVLLITLLTQCGRGKRTAPTTSTETVPIVAEVPLRRISRIRSGTSTRSTIHRIATHSC